MKFKEIIGIDISKSTFDVHIFSTNTHLRLKNKNSGYKILINKVEKICGYKQPEILYVLEHTGMYSHNISLFFSQSNIPFVLVPGLAIKRSLGITRGKDDKIDAAKIALYGYRRRDELKPYTMPGEELLAIKRLIGLRERLVKQRSGYKTSLSEIKKVYLKKDNKILFDTQEKMIKYLNNQINAIEKEIDTLLNSSEQLQNLYDLITSIKGVGNQTAIYLIVYTNAFTKFDTWRKFASYCGIAPFPNRSGTSIRGKTKISHLANKKIKSLLDLCAKSAIQHNQEMKKYYERRILEGKNKRSTINIIRNKLLSRIFAVVKRKTPYVDILKYAA